jgi:hypothetical protein
MRAVINSPAPRVRQVRRFFNMAVFAMMLVVVLACLFADSDVLATESDEYRQLIVARDVFSCGPRFSSLAQELVFFTLPFMLVCLTLVGFTIGMMLSIWKMVKKVPGSSVSGSVNKFGKVAGKLMTLAVAVFIRWLVRVSIAAAQELIITSFNMGAKKWKDCQMIEAETGTYTSQVVYCVSKYVAWLITRLKLTPFPFPPSIANMFLLTSSMIMMIKWNVMQFQMLGHPCGLPAFLVLLSKICRVI